MIKLSCSLNKKIVDTDVKQAYVLGKGSVGYENLSEGLKEKIELSEEAVENHAGDAYIHVTTDDKERWNSGASDAAALVDEVINGRIPNRVEELETYRAYKTLIVKILSMDEDGGSTTVELSVDLWTIFSAVADGTTVILHDTRIQNAMHVYQLSYHEPFHTVSNNIVIGEIHFTNTIGTHMQQITLFRESNPNGVNERIYYNKYDLSTKEDVTDVANAIETAKSDIAATSDTRYLPKSTVEGVAPQATLAINADAANVQVFGNSTQETSATGKNLANPKLYPYKFEGSISSGYTIAAIGSNEIANMLIIPIEGNTTYAISFSNADLLNGNVLRVAIFDTYPVIGTTSIFAITKSGKFTVASAENAKYLVLRILLNDITEENMKTVVDTIQVEKSKTYTDYEPFIPNMPSPDFPSEVKSVGELVTDGEYAGKYKTTVKAVGKNLFDIDNLNVYQMTPNTSYTVTDGILRVTSSVTNAYRALYLNLDTIPVADCAGKTYTLSYYYKKPNDNTGVIAVGYIRASDRQFINIVNSKSFTTTSAFTRCDMTFTVPDNISDIMYGEYLVTTLYSNFNGSLTSAAFSWIEYKDIQLEENSTATAYEPCFEYAANVYSDEPLRKIGDMADCVDLKSGKAKRNIFEYVFTGNEVWYTDNINENTVYGHVTADIPAVLEGYKVIGFSEKGIFDNKAIVNTDYAHCQYYYTGNNDRLFIRINKSCCADPDNPKSQDLRNIYNAGTKIYGIRAEPVYEDIIIEPLQLHDGANNIFATTEIQPSNIVVDYYQNPTMVIEELNTKIENLTNAILASGGNV